MSRKKLPLELEFDIENIRLESNPEKANCHINAVIIADELKKKGFDVNVVKGIYSNPPIAIRHSWIEFEDKILETDCKQLSNGEWDLMPNNKTFAILDKKKFSHRYIFAEITKGKEGVDIEC